MNLNFTKTEIEKLKVYIDMLYNNDKKLFILYTPNGEAYIDISNIKMILPLIVENNYRLSKIPVSNPAISISYGYAPINIQLIYDESTAHTIHRTLLYVWTNQKNMHLSHSG